MKLTVSLALAGLFVVLLATSCLSQGIPSGSVKVAPSNVDGKKLIRAGDDLERMWGASSIAAADLPAKIAVLQDAGYDGLVFSIASSDKSKGYPVMTGQWWNCAVRRSYEEYVPEIKAFQSVKKWGRITDNFTRAMPAVWGSNMKCQDWFSDEDWDVVLSNATVMAKVVKDCGLKGVMLDTEQYDHHAQGVWHYPWNYPLYAESGYKAAGEAKPKTFAEVAAKVEERGRQYGEAITKDFPDLTLIVIAGMYENAWTSALTTSKEFTLEKCTYALYPAFLDGLLQGLDKRAKIIAGTETTYLDSQYKEMLVIRDAELQQAQMLSKYKDLTRKRITFSAGIWTDAGWGADRFSNTDVAVNQRDPERHMHAVHNALAASDEYAWQWGEMGDWLSPTPTTLIKEYWKANVEGHNPQNLDWAPEPKWDMTDYSKYEADNAKADSAFWAEAKNGGWKIAVELPDYWKFIFDTETLVRYRGQWLSPDFDDRSWQYLSVLKCWQSQSVKANGPAVYRTRFKVPADIDPKTQEVVLAFAGFPPDDAKKTGWMDVHLNGKAYPIRHIIDVTDSIIPGKENFVGVRVINKSGPAGLTGHVKLMVRGGAKEVQPAPLPTGDRIFFEDFKGYQDGTPLSKAGWTTEEGDVKITKATGLGPSILAIDGKTPTAAYTRAFKPFTSPINQGDTVVFSAKVYAYYGESWTHIGLRTTAATGVLLGNNGWHWVLDAQELAGKEKTAEFWPYTEADPWNNRELTARIVVDSKTHKVWASLTDTKGNVHKSAEIDFVPGTETKLTGVIVYPTNTQPGKNADIGEISVERAAKK